jgi:CBS domain-containing protein
MQCAEVMKTDVVTVSPGDTAQVAARRMRDADVGFLPVCDAEGKVLGTLTDRDIAIRLVAEDLPGGTSAVDDIMSREVIACRPADEIAHVEQLMAEYRKSRILVTDEAGRLFGVISLSDVARLEEGPRRTATTMRRVASRETRL